MGYLEEKETLGEILPYERDLIPNFESIQSQITALLTNEDEEAKAYYQDSKKASHSESTHLPTVDPF
jgi:hypothetical protein